MNSRTCFQGFFSASEPKKSLLLKSFCFYHIDFPGCEVPEESGTLSPQQGGSTFTLQDVSLQVGEALKQLNIKKALGMGVGSGAYILAKTSLAFPKVFDGLIFFAPCCTKATWWEYTYGKILLNCLWLYGWNSKFAHTHLYQRLFSPSVVARQQQNYGVSDLLYTFNQEVEKINPKGVMKYLQAVLCREDILNEV